MCSSLLRMESVVHVWPTTMSDARLQGLKGQLQAIKAARNKGARDLLVYLKAYHPPKFGRNLREPQYDDLKKALRNASIDYHPDRQKDGDRVWQVLSQEITKQINEVWAEYKS